VTAAIDRRVKVIVGQVPLVTGSLSFTQLVRIDQWASTEEMFAADRLARLRGESPAMVPVVDDDPMAPSALPKPDSHQWFTATRTGSDTGSVEFGGVGSRQWAVNGPRVASR
jgi:uncharacterized protein